MSQDDNTRLLERAADLLDEFQSHPSGYDKALAQAICANDLTTVYYYVTQMEAVLSEEHFRQYDLVVF